MRHLFTATALAALVLATPALAKPDHDGKGKSAKFERDFSKAAKGKPAKIDKAFKKQAKRIESADRAVVERRVDRVRDVRRVVDRDVRYDRDDRDRRLRVVERDVRRYVPAQFVTGCPPGLAKKRNGCLPPGQAKKLYVADDRYANWLDRVPVRYRDGGDYRYSGGYLTRSNGRSITSYLPLLGSALGIGQLFPANYGQAVPDRYGSLYSRTDDTAYRYADNAIFALNPTTQSIQSVVALVTGDRFTVGQPMPSGYDVYNVPGAYRDRYQDGPDANYRYADGQVYRVDPTTRLVQAVVSLLT